jgi:hypothetical protein
MLRRHVLAVMVVGVVALAAPAFAAHNGNNYAELTGVQGTDVITGTAVINYSEGQGTFNSTLNASGLDAGDYRFTVNGPAGVQEICTFTVSGGGRQGCSAQDQALGGFGSAQIREAGSGAIVASGTFERRGNCRDPQQGGSQCESPVLNP